MEYDASVKFRNNGRHEYTICWKKTDSGEYSFWLLNLDGSIINDEIMIHNGTAKDIAIQIVAILETNS